MNRTSQQAGKKPALLIFGLVCALLLAAPAMAQGPLPNDLPPRPPTPTPVPEVPEADTLLLLLAGLPALWAYGRVRARQRKR